MSVYACCVISATQLLFFLVPTNLVHPLISSEPLANPLPSSASSPHPALLSSHPLPSPSDPEVLTAAVGAITKLYAAAKNPVVLVDAIAERIGVEDLVMELVEATGMTVFVSPMGKGTIDENHPQFGGVSISYRFDQSPDHKGTCTLVGVCWEYHDSFGPSTRVRS